MYLWQMRNRRRAVGRADTLYYDDFPSRTMNEKNQQHSGSGELIDARRESRALYWAVGLFSFFANILMLTGPLYMLQVYDRVLGSRSFETLLALSLLVMFLYGVMGLLDYARGRVMGRAAARFQTRMERRVFDSVLKSSSTKPSPEARTGQKDLSAVQQLMGSPVLMAIFDLPWTPVFLVGISLFHPWLGMLAVSGGGAVDRVYRAQSCAVEAALGRGGVHVAWGRHHGRADPLGIRDGARHGHAGGGL